MKKLFITLIVLIVNYFHLKGQSVDTNNDGPPVQDNASLNNQSINSNVDLSTGSVSSSIHLMDLDGGNGSSLNLNLIYQGNKGMKVNDIAGPFGTGFHLKGGGFIRRIIRGIADEKEYGVTTQVQRVQWYPGYINANTGDIGWIIEGFGGGHYTNPNYYRSLLAPSGELNWDVIVNNYYKQVYSNIRTPGYTKLDGEPDIYQFEFGNYKGSFVFGNDDVPILIPYQDIKINMPYSYDVSEGHSGASISNSWIFTTSDGTRYEFTNSADFTEYTHIEQNTPVIYGALITDYISQWNLSSITTTDGNIYTFSYENENPILISNPKDYMQVEVSGEQGSISPANFSVDNQYTITHKRLMQISSQFGRINFDKSLTPRLDFTNQYSVGSIKKYNNNGDVQSFVSFNYDSYLNSPCPNGKRLFLNSLTFENLTGATERKIYSFKYYFDTTMPDINSKQQDLYGYWNNNSTNNLVPSAGTYINGGDRSIYPSHTIIGILKKIIFPAGGSKEFFYESNDFYNSVTGTNELIGGMRVNKIVEHPEFSQSNDITTLYLYKDELISTRSSGEALPIRKLFDIQPTINSPLQPLQSNTIYCLVGAQPRREMSDDWIRYKTVTVQQPGNGKKIFKLTSHSTNPDVPAERFKFANNVLLANAYNQYYDDKDNDAGAPNTDMSFDRGLITNVSNYNEAGNKIEETVYNYDFNPSGFLAKEVVALKATSDSDVFRGQNKSNVYNLEYYKYVSKMHVLNNMTYYFYDIQNSLSVSEITNYFYNLLKHPYVTEIKKTNSDNSIVSTKYIYPLDISSHGTEDGHYFSSDSVTMGVYNMIDKNILSTPLETITKIQNSNGTFVTAASLKTFEIFNLSALQPNGIKLSKTYELEIDQPITDFNELHLDVDHLFIKDSRYVLRKTYDKYDSKGNLIQESYPFGISNSYIYCNAFSKMIGKISNAKISTTNLGNESSCTSFESTNTNNADHWLDNPDLNVYFSSIGHTGKKSFKIIQGVGPTRQFKPENQFQKYRFSCYVKTENGFIPSMGLLGLYTQHDNDYDISIYPNVSGSNISIPFSDTQGEWKYIEGIIDLEKIRAISEISSTTILRIGCAISNLDPTHYILVDDIRFQPFYSDFVTITYDKISGNGSSTTNNNATSTYYNYDGLNQISSISDNNHKVIQSYSNHLNHELTSSEYNFQKMSAYAAPHSISEVNNGSVSESEIIRDCIYFDGLSRPIQRNLQGIESDGTDLIQPITYDEFGRQNKKYLPFSDGDASGLFRANSLNSQLSFYQSAPFIEHSNKPFLENKFDNSPLNLVNEIGSPGANWSIGSGHTKTRKILTNSSSDDVINWNYSGSIINGQNNFINGVLYKLEEYDEDGNKKIVFRNKIGQILLERKSAKCIGTGVNLVTKDQAGVINNGTNAGSLTHFDTYYVYDSKGLLSFIIPPAAAKKFKVTGILQFNETDPVFIKFTFNYKYDNRERLVSRRVPGQQGLNYYVYNKRNQLVLFQSPDQYDGGKWNYIKYDVLGRNILNGIYLTSSLNNPALLQAQVNSNVLIWEKRISPSTGFFEYTDQQFPTVSGNGNSMLVAHYYDDYTWDNGARNFQSFGTTSTNSIVCYGIETGKKDMVLDGATIAVYLTTLNYFDDKLRLIQAHKKHILNDWDIFSNEYSFTSRLLKNIREHRLSNKITTITSRYLYDRANRLTDIFKTLSKFDGTNTTTDNEVHEAFFQYNKIGQVIKKSLHYDWAGTATYLQEVDYRYNIRGWLTSINNSKLINDGGITNADDIDAFGENIYYGNCSATDLSAADGTIKGNPQFNGNISAVKWKVRSPNLLPTKAIEQLYVYRYDGLNRMTAGYYASDENLRGYVNTRDNTKNFDELVDYDLMGNITSLRRNNLLGQIDNLTYSYDGNQLTNIVDNATLQSDFDFHDKSNTTDYLYNKKGSLITDNNKGLNIIYNDINLPQSITQLGINLGFIYSGSGEKLKKIIFNTKYYYISGIEYEDKGDGQGPNLVFIQTEEGRIRQRSIYTINPGISRNFVFDYFLKDHLGNVRAVLSEEITKRTYYATMETQNTTAENALFTNINETRTTKPVYEPVNEAAASDEMVSELGGGSALKVGIAKVLKVNQGDQIDINTKYFFDITNFVNTQYTVSDFLAQLASTFISSTSNFAASVSESQLAWTQQTFQNNPGINSFLTTSFQNPTINDPTKPHSYLVYLFFDDKFNFHSDASGVLQVKIPNVLGNLGILNLKMPANGFFYVYTNNESNVKVYFNDLTIAHYTSVLKEENHFYPYGLLMEGITPVVAANGSINKYKFSDKELQLELGLNQYDFSARFYDPVIGRFNVIDPFADFAGNFTSYRYAFDNPVSITDRTGLFEDDEHFDGPGGNGYGEGIGPVLGSPVYFDDCNASGIGDQLAPAWKMPTFESSNSNNTSDNNKTCDNNKNEVENHKGDWNDEFDDRDEEDNFATDLAEGILAAIYVDLQIPDLSDVSPHKWTTEAILGGVAGTILFFDWISGMGDSKDWVKEHRPSSEDPINRNQKEIDPDNFKLPIGNWKPIVRWGIAGLGAAALKDVYEERMKELYPDGIAPRDNTMVASPFIRY